MSSLLPSSKNWFLFLIGCCLIISLEAQNTFVKVLNYKDNNRSTTLDLTSDNGFIVAGQLFDSVYQIINGVTVTKFSKNGDIEWEKELHSQFTVEIDKIVTCKDGGCLLCGRERDTILAATKSCVIKISAIGQILWSKSYGSVAPLPTLDIELTNDSGFVLICSQLNGLAGETLLKMDKHGAIIWEKRYSDVISPGSRGICNVKLTYEGGYFIVCGRHLIKLDALGNILWSNQVKGKTAVPYDIRQASDSGYFVVYTQLRSSSDHNLTFIKLNKEGDTLWTKAYHNPLNSNIGYRNMDNTSDGGFVIAGGSGTANLLGNRVFLMKIDSLGNKVWNRFYGLETKSGSYAHDVKQSPDGGYLICGEIFSIDTNVSRFSAYIIKTDSLGHAGCHELNSDLMEYTASLYVDTVLMNTAISNSNDSITFTSVNIQAQSDWFECEKRLTVGTRNQVRSNPTDIYPNPTSDQLNILDKERVVKEIYIFGITGKIHKSKKGNVSSINVSELPNGVYFIKIITSGNVTTKKFIKN